MLKRSIVDVLFELSFIKVLHPFGWYLQYLFGCYIFAYIVYGFIKNRKVQITLTIAAAVISFVVFYQLKMGTKAEQAFSFTGGLLYAMYSKNTQVPQKINFKCILLGMSMLFIGAFALFCKQLPFFRNEHPEFMIPLDLVLKSTVALGLIILTCKVYFGEKIIHPIGRFSYSIYLVHAYTIMLAQKLAFSRYIFFVLFFLSTTIIATISWYFIIYKIKDKVKKIIKV